jgi:chlorite dismutase
MQMSENGTSPNNSAGEDRQFVHFSFYKLDPAWRRLPEAEQEASRADLAATIESFGERFALRSYTVAGLRPDADFMLWKVSERLEDFQELGTAVMSTAMGGYLTTPYAYLSMTRRSQYVKGEGRSMHKRGRIMWNPDSKYLLIYPMVKTRAWYQLSKPARQGIMNEHIAAGHQFPTVKINTTYSFGIDDQEFVVAFETDFVGDFLDLMMTLRETEASRYTERDTPIFTCISCSVRRPCSRGTDGHRPRPRRSRPGERAGRGCSRSGEVLSGHAGCQGD